MYRERVITWERQRKTRKNREDYLRGVLKGNIVSRNKRKEERLE